MPKILVVDDDPLIRDVVAAVEGDAGHEVVEAKDGEEGIEAFRQNEIDLVITDFEMPRNYLENNTLRMSFMCS